MANEGGSSCSASKDLQTNLASRHVLQLQGEIRRWTLVSKKLPVALEVVKQHLHDTEEVAFANFEACRIKSYAAGHDAPCYCSLQRASMLELQQVLSSLYELGQKTIPPALLLVRDYLEEAEDKAYHAWLEPCQTWAMSDSC